LKKRGITMKVQVFGVKWETDNTPEDSEVLGTLPTNVVLDIPNWVDTNDEEELLDFISDELSNEYGFLHNGWPYHKLIEE
jgi:hypothetical protein